MIVQIDESFSLLILGSFREKKARVSYLLERYDHDDFLNETSSLSLPAPIAVVMQIYEDMWQFKKEPLFTVDA